MSLAFKVYERAESSLEDLGTLAQLAGRGSKLAFIPSNLMSTKRVTIVVANAKGESATVTCSANISSAVRNALKEGTSKSAVLGTLANLTVFEREDGAHYLAQQGSGELDFHEISKAVKEAISVEELVAF